MALVGRDWIGERSKMYMLAAISWAAFIRLEEEEVVQVGNLFLVNGIAFASIRVDFDINQVSFHAVLIILGAFVDAWGHCHWMNLLGDFLISCFFIGCLIVHTSCIFLDKICHGTVGFRKFGLGFWWSH
jgi:hypothetical protein